MNRLKDIIYDWVGRLSTIGLRNKPARKKLLIVRVDEIGDYILWRNFLKEIVAAEKLKGFDIHFCGNQSWQSLFETFDASGIEKTYWLRKKAFKKNMRYRYRFLLDIYLEGYAKVLNPAFSRDKRNDDAIVKAAAASESIGMVGNRETVRAYETGYDRGLYTSLFDLTEKPVFEFYRNRSFTEFVTGHLSSVTNTNVPVEQLPPARHALPEKYFVVFPGSRSAARIWPTEHFITVSNHLFEKYAYTAVVCGAQNDAYHTGLFCARYTHPLVDLTNRTSLPDMLSILHKAQCLLSVDTGSLHLAAAVGCRVYGIFNGGQYRRFAPYPKQVFDGFTAVYPDEVEAELNDEQVIRDKYEFVVPVPYASVTPQKVIALIDRT